MSLHPHLLLVVGNCLLELLLQEARERVLQVGAHFPSVLAVPVAHGEEVAVLQSREMRNCYPVILVSFIGVGGGEASLGGKGELCHAVRVHLGRV